MNAWTQLRQHWAESAKKQPDFRTPDETALLQDMHKAYAALEKLGWQDAIYCPKDGTVFLAITAGSTGVHPCHYQGSWPDGRWWILEAGDAWPARPILWKEMPKELAT